MAAYFSSAKRRSSVSPAHWSSTIADAGTLAKALIAIAPERMLWATNWPHPGEPAGHKPDEAMLLDTLLYWADDDTTWRKILADNPARLYGF
jgi:D-galactarolactone isomerase